MNRIRRQIPLLHSIELIECIFKWNFNIKGLEQNIMGFYFRYRGYFKKIGKPNIKYYIYFFFFFLFMYYYLFIFQFSKFLTCVRDKSFSTVYYNSQGTCSIEVKPANIIHKSAQVSTLLWFKYLAFRWISSASVGNDSWMQQTVQRLHTTECNK